MEFVHPERLWLLFLVLIPILIHLFHFRKRKTLFFSSLRFIQYLEKQEQSARKLKHYLILATRILALSSLILAFANPFIPTSTSQKSGKNAVIIYLDNSFSMTALGAEGTILSEGRELAKRVLTQIKPNTNVLICSNHLNSQEQFFVTKAEALRYLDQLEPFALSRSLDEILDWQTQQIKQHEALVGPLSTVQRFLISDFQSQNAQLKNQEPAPQDPFYLYKLSAQKPNNVFIDSIWFGNPTQQYDANQELFARISHSGTNAENNLELNLELGKTKRTMFLKIGNNQSKVVSFPFTEKNKGAVKGNMSITDAQIHFDDTWNFAYEVAAATRICLIQNETASKRVAAAYAVEPRYQVTQLEPGAVNSEKLTASDLIVLNGLDDIPTGLRPDLIEAVANGHKLLIIPGAKIATQSYNPLLEALQLPQLGAITTSGLQLQKIAYDDPFFKGVFEKQLQRLQTPIVSKHYDVKGQRQSVAIPLLTLRSGQALFLSARQNAFLFTASLDPSFGSLAQQTLFPTILLRCGEFAAQRYPLHAIIGQDAQVGIRAQAPGDLPIKMNTKDFEFIPQIRKMEGLIQINLSGPSALEKLKAGIYQLLAPEPIGQLALNYPRTESRLNYLNSQDLQDLFASNGIKNCKFNSIKDGQSLAALQIDQVAYYWRVLLLLSLLFLLLELALLKWWK
jgi:hypothetical protein